MVLEELILSIRAQTSGMGKALKGADKIAARYSKASATITRGMFAAGAALAGVGIAALKVGSDIQEADNFLGVAFGDGADSFRKFADDLASKTAASKFELRALGSEFQLLLRNQLGSSEAAQKASQELLKRAQDIASIKNVPLQKVIEDMRSALTGSTETMEKYGVNVKIGALENTAFAKSLGKSWKEMTQAEQAAVRYSAMLDQTSFAAGDAIKTKNDLAQSMVNIKNKFYDAFGELAKRLTPAFERILVPISKFADKVADSVSTTEKFEATMNTLREWIITDGLPVVAALTVAIGGLAAVLVLANLPFIIMAAKIALVGAAMYGLVKAGLWMWEVLKDIGAWISDTFFDVMDWMAVKINAVVDGIAEALASAKEFLGPRVQKVLDFVGLGDVSMGVPVRPAATGSRNVSQVNNVNSSFEINAAGADAGQVAKIVQQEQRSTYDNSLSEAHSALTPNYGY